MTARLACAFEIPAADKSPPRVHMIGIAGSGMKALSEIFADDGWIVSGSDQALPDRIVEHFRELSITSPAQLSALNEDERPDLVVFSAAVPANNDQLLFARQSKIPVLNFSQAIARVTRGLRCISIFGTHGKSSTTSLINAILEIYGHTVSFVCGAERTFDGRNGRFRDCKDIVVESCEYQRHFLNYRPEIACLLNVDHDHVDAYPSANDMISAYRDFIQRIPSTGTLIYNADCDNASKLAADANSKICSYSLEDPSADWTLQESGPRFEIRFQQKPMLLGFAQQCGIHERRNLLAAFATAEAMQPRVCQSTSLDLQRILDHAALRLRFEVVAENDHRCVIADYAHHPTEIAATLNSARFKHPHRRIVCCFQPHQLSRTQAFFEEFVAALSLADRVYVLPAYPAREQLSAAHDEISQKIVEQLVHCGIAATSIPSLDQVWSTLDTDALDGDLVITMGAGDLNRIHYERI